MKNNFFAASSIYLIKCHFIKFYFQNWMKIVFSKQSVHKTCKIDFCIEMSRGWANFKTNGQRIIPDHLPFVQLKENWMKLIVIVSSINFILTLQIIWIDQIIFPNIIAWNTRFDLPENTLCPFIDSFHRRSCWIIIFSHLKVSDSLIFCGGSTNICNLRLKWYNSSSLGRGGAI